MSNKGTVFEAGTGKALYYGNANNKEVRDLQAAGNLFVEDQQRTDDQGRPLKWDFVNGVAVVDQDAIDEKSQNEQNEQNRKDRIAAIKVRLEELYGDHSKPAIDEQVDLLNELARL